MKRINILGEATEAVLAWSPGRQSFRVPRGAYVALLLIIMFGALAALAASPAHATTVRGKFQYKDKNLVAATETDRPIANAKVEIWRFRSRCFLCPWTWAKDATTWTDANGSISLNMPFAGNGVVYGVRVFATNNAAIVYRNNPLLPAPPFYGEPREVNGQIMHKTESSSSSVLDFSYTFDSWASQHFNIAEVARQGKLYADARRAPGETDPIGPANLQPFSTFGSYYNPVNDTVYINSAKVNDDRTILHEYAHYLEEMISSFAPVPTYHYGCDATNLVGTPSNTPDIAWMEGFAEYFSQTVQTSLPPGTITGDARPGLETKYYEQADSFCQGLPESTHPGDGVETFVAGTLWDVYDQPSDPGSLNEAHDTTLARMDRQIFEIFDRELDVYGVWPTITHFRHAWMGRGLPGVELSRIMVKHHIPQAPREAIVTEGTLREGTVGRLFADDNAYYQVNSTTSGTRRTSWFGSFDVSNNLLYPRITYKGMNSASCLQTVDVFRWTDSTWVPLSQLSVGTTEVNLANLVPSGAGTASDFVSGNSGLGELRVRVGCTSSSSSFYSSADLLRITYQLP